MIPEKSPNPIYFRHSNRPAVAKILKEEALIYKSGIKTRAFA
jgi:hypothetical protein